MNLNIALQTYSTNIGEINPKLLDKLYKDYAKTYHPDKGGSGEKFKQINEAKETITQYLELKKCITHTKKYTNTTIYTCIPNPELTGLGTAADPFVSGTLVIEMKEIDPQTIFRIIKPKSDE
jgi:hypothetical protein